jgi:hypothetical protein
MNRSHVQLNGSGRIHVKLAIEYNMNSSGEMYVPMTEGQIATISAAPSPEARKELLKSLVLRHIWDSYDDGDKELDRWDYNIQSDSGDEDYILDDWGLE